MAKEKPGEHRHHRAHPGRDNKEGPARPGQSGLEGQEGAAYAGQDYERRGFAHPLPLVEPGRPLCVQVSTLLRGPSGGFHSFQCRETWEAEAWCNRPVVDR